MQVFFDPWFIKFIVQGGVFSLSWYLKMAIILNSSYFLHYFILSVVPSPFWEEGEIWIGCPPTFLSIECHGISETSRLPLPMLLPTCSQPLLPQLITFWGEKSLEVDGDAQERYTVMTFSFTFTFQLNKITDFITFKNLTKYLKLNFADPG